jgi:hypothetical protein
MGIVPEMSRQAQAERLWKLTTITAIVFKAGLSRVRCRVEVAAHQPVL